MAIADLQPPSRQLAVEMLAIPTDISWYVSEPPQAETAAPATAFNSSMRMDAGLDAALSDVFVC